MLSLETEARRWWVHLEVETSRPRPWRRKRNFYLNVHAFLMIYLHIIFTPPVGERISMSSTSHFVPCRYAVKHGYPVLQYASLPRIGAIKVVLDELSPTSSKQLKDIHTSEYGNRVSRTSVLNFFIYMICEHSPLSVVTEWTTVRRKDLENVIVTNKWWFGCIHHKSITMTFRGNLHISWCDSELSEFEYWFTWLKVSLS